MRTGYEKAISFIKDHGAFAAYTRDGLVAQSDCVWHENAMPDHVAAFVDDDVYFVETTVFDVDDDDGTVDVNAIRNWLGY